MFACRRSCWGVYCLLVAVAALGVSASQFTPLSPHHHGSSSPPMAFTSPLPTNTSSQAVDYDYYDYYYDDEVLDLPIKNLTYTRILFLCEYLYSGQYGSYDGLTDAVMPYGNSSVTVVGEERLVNICLPYYHLLRPGRCDKKPFISACLFDDIVFLHGHGCSRPSPDDAYFDQLLAKTLLEEDEPCFQAVCRGEVRVVRQEVEGHTVHLFSPVTLHSTCHKYLLLFYPSEWPNTPTAFQNVHWPSCFSGYDVVWSREPGDGGVEIIKTWSYLPPHCRTREHVLAAVMGLVVVGGVTGNVLVLMASAWRAHHRDPTEILCMSLAAAEFLMCMFVLAPALHSHLKVMQGVADEEELPHGASKGSDARLLLDVGVEKVEGGFLMLSSHVLNAGCVVSVPTVMLIALDQCLSVSGRSIREELTMRCIRGFVAASWSFGALLSVALVYGGGAFWYSFFKLPLSVPPREFGLVLVGVACVLALMSGVTVVLSFVTVWRTLRRRAVGSMHRHVVLMVVTAALHLVSVCAAGTAFLLPLTGISNPRLEETRFLCWWGFLASTCWHPCLLSMSRQHFRESAIALAARCRLLVTGPTVSVTPSPPLSPRPPPRPRPKLAPGRRRRFLPGVRYYK